jgi:hypothetical protein
MMRRLTESALAFLAVEVALHGGEIGVGVLAAAVAGAGAFLALD